MLWFVGGRGTNRTTGAGIERTCEEALFRIRRNFSQFAAVEWNRLFTGVPKTADSRLPVVQAGIELIFYYKTDMDISWLPLARNLRH